MATFLDSKATIYSEKNKVKACKGKLYFYSGFNLSFRGFAGHHETITALLSLFYSSSTFVEISDRVFFKFL